MHEKANNGIAQTPRIALEGIGVLLLARFLLVLTLPIEGIKGYGDVFHFFQIAALKGYPYITYWSEFPPIFPFLSELIFQISSGKEHIYLYLFFFTVSIVDCGSFYLFSDLMADLFQKHSAQRRTAFFLALLMCLPYSWWYFDSLAVFTILFGIHCILRKKELFAGVLIGIGTLIKLFPLLAIIPALKIMGLQKTLKIGLVAGAMVALVYGSLAVISPQYTMASLSSQFNKGSWETVWAIMDGNRGTGNFGDWQERYDPATAGWQRGNPAVIPGAVGLVVAGMLGLAGIWTTPRAGGIKALAGCLFGFCLLFIASPGWSVQWVLYLIPIILLTLPMRQAVLFTVVLVLVNVLEWPVLLSRGYFDYLPLTVITRTLILVLLAVVSYQLMRQENLILGET